MHIRIRLVTLAKHQHRPLFRLCGGSAAVEWKASPEPVSGNSLHRRMHASRHHSPTSTGSAASCLLFPTVNFGSVHGWCINTINGKSQGTLAVHGPTLHPGWEICTTNLPWAGDACRPCTPAMTARVESAREGGLHANIHHKGCRTLVVRS